MENENESWNETEAKVKSVFRENLKIEEDIEIYRAHRVGKKGSDKTRTIGLRCTRYKQKEKVQQETKRLKRTGIYINDDFSNETMEKRKMMLKTVRTLRNQGKGAKIKNGQVVTWEWERNRPTTFGEL